MKKLITAFCFMFALSPLAFAQDKAKTGDTKASAAAPAAEKKAAPAPAAEKKAATTEKKAAKKEASEKQKAQRAKMKSCSKEATDKKMKGDDRKKFMSGCMKG